MHNLRISDVRFVAASAEDVERGILGWISLVLNDTIQLDGVTLRRTLDGRLTVSFPARRDGKGQQHFFVRPLNDATRREVENAILTAIGFEEAHR